jgi:hypothetical protein
MLLCETLFCISPPLVQALRLCTGRTAYRGSRGIALPFHDHGTRRGWGVTVTPWPLFTPGKDPVPVVQETGWAPGPVWTGAENLTPTGIRSPDRPARSQSLYRLSYRAPLHLTRTVKIEWWTIRPPTICPLRCLRNGKKQIVPVYVMVAYGRLGVLSSPFLSLALEGNELHSLLLYPPGCVSLYQLNRSLCESIRLSRTFGEQKHFLPSSSMSSVTRCEITMAVLKFDSL